MKSGDERLYGEPWIYGIQSGLFIKVGVSRSIRHRLLEMNALNPHPCRVAIRYQSVDAFWIEKRMHELLERHSIGREWFAASVDQVRAALHEAKRMNKERRDLQAQWEYESAVRLAAKEERKAARLARFTWTREGGKGKGGASD